MRHAITPLGIGPSLQDPLYGLLDVDQNFFYIVDYKKNMIDLLHDVMSSHKNVTIIPIHTCLGWFHQQIDNSVCCQWGVNFFDSHERIPGLMDNNMRLIPKSSGVAPSTQIIIKNLFYLVSVCEKIEGCNKFYFDYRTPKNVLIMFADDHWIQAAHKTELNYDKHAKTRWQDLLQQIYQLMKRHDINTEQYADSINQSIKKLAIDTIPYFYPLKNLYD